MKQHLRSLWTLLLLMMWCSVGFAQTTVTFVAGTDKSNLKTLTKDGVTLTIGDGKFNLDTDFRCYGKKNFTVSSDADITKIEFTCTQSGSDKGSPTGFSLSTKNGTYTCNKNIGTWSGTATKVVFYANQQVQMKKIVVTLASSKTPTNLTFPKPTINIEEGNEATFTGQKATLKTGETVLDKAITYAYSGSEIFATFNTATGEATLKTGVYGTAIVTATYEGDDTYEEAKASYTVKIVDPNAIVPLVFDKADDVFGTLNNYDSNNATISEYSLKGSDGNSYTFKTNGGKDAAKNGNLKLKKNTGTLESPIFENLENGYTVNITFSQLGKNPLEITSGGVTKEADITSENGKNIEGTGFLLSMNIKPGNTFTLDAGNVAYISKIEIVAIPGITLEEDADNTDAKIEANNGKTIDVKLTRSLKAGLWNTICLPFDVTAEQVESVLKATGNVKEFDKEDEASATIYFKPATEMKAGVPYLIKPTADALMLEFKGVTINNVDELSRINGNRYCICGVFGKTKLRTTGTDLFLNAAGKFVAPAVGKETMKGFRAYFNVPSNASAAALNINIDGETTGINNIETNATVNGKVYNLNGQYVGNSLNGLKKGIYVVNGKKVIK